MKNCSLFPILKSTLVKPGVEGLFNDSPELSSIGTKEQYSQYLNSIFPDSKIKDIVYHGTDIEFDKFDKSKIGTKEKGALAYGFNFGGEQAKVYAGNFGRGKKVLLSNLLNIKNPLILVGLHEFATSSYPNFKENSFLITLLKENGYDVTSWQYFKNSDNGKVFDYVSDVIGLKNFTNILIKNGYDGLESIVASKKNPEIVAFEPEQIHILGSKQDIQGFKDFVNTTESTTKSFNELISTGEIQYVDEETGDLCAKHGGRTNFHRGGKWELVKDLKGFPTHEKGGVDLVIGKNGVSIKNVNSEIKAEKGLVIPGVKQTTTPDNDPDKFKLKRDTDTSSKTDATRVSVPDQNTMNINATINRANDARSKGDFDKTNLEEDNFEQEQGIGIHQYRYENEPEYKAIIDKQLAEDKGPKIDHFSTDKRSANYQGHPNDAWRYPNLKNTKEGKQIAEKLTDVDNEIISALLPLPGQSIKKAKQVAQGVGLVEDVTKQVIRPGQELADDIRLFHGSADDTFTGLFDETIAREKAGGRGISSDGLWLTSNDKAAEIYASSYKNSKGKVFEYDVDVSKLKLKEYDDFHKYQTDFYGDSDFDAYFQNELKKSKADKSYVPDLQGMNRKKESFTQRLKNEGYDGVKLKSSRGDSFMPNEAMSKIDDYDQYMILNPNEKLKQVAKESESIGIVNNIVKGGKPLTEEEKEMMEWFMEKQRISKLPVTSNKDNLQVLEDFKTRIQTPEGKRRLEALYINSDKLLQKLEIIEDSHSFGYYNPNINKIALHPDIPMKRNVVRHEIEHGVQNASRESILKKIKDMGDTPNERAMSGLTEIDEMLDGLELRKGLRADEWGVTSSRSKRNKPLDPADISNFKHNINNKQLATDYFLTGSGGKEKSAFLAEVHQYMIDSKVIPSTSYAEITPEMVRGMHIDAAFDENSGKYLRMFNIMSPSKNNYKLLANALNKMLSLAPVALGAEALKESKKND